MIHNYVHPNVNTALPELLNDLLIKGEEFGSRAGRTQELMHVGITLQRPWQRELVLPERKANVAAQIAETMWVLAGRNDTGWLSHYLPRAADFSDDGSTWRAGYGPRLRNWPGREGALGVDQLDYIVRTLRSSPGSRQAVATIWDPTVDTTPGKDIACNNWLSFSSRLGKLDLHVAIRSNDAMWGWSGINAFEWSVLLEIVAGMCGLMVGQLHFSITSFHLYEQHWPKARRIADDDSFSTVDDSPRFNATGLDDMTSWDELARQWFEVEGMIRTGNNDMLPFAVNNFPEPMLQSWLRVLQWYWSGSVVFLQPLRGTRLYEACRVGLKPAGAPQEPGSDPVALEQLRREMSRPGFLDHVNQLHADKHAAYGDSWKRRGELGILGNIARKIDRLESGADTTDETQADTAIDLLVYLAKYRCWLDNPEAGGPSDVRPLLDRLATTPPADTTSELVADFSVLEQCSEWARSRVVNDMLPKAFALAKLRW